MCFSITDKVQQNYEKSKMKKNELESVFEYRIQLIPKTTFV